MVNMASIMGMANAMGMDMVMENMREVKSKIGQVKSKIK
jgi:hypothetical protein